jgi:MFS family permease
VWSRDAKPRRPAGRSTPHGGTPVGFMTAMALAMGIGPLLLYALTATSPRIVAELDLSRTQFGTFATTAFVAAALSSSLVGTLVDRINERVTMYLLYGGSALALWLAAAAQAYVWMLAAVVLSGGVQALSNPVTNRLIARHTPLSGRGTAIGVKQAGVQMAQAFAGFVLPALALVAGWRGALVTASVLALAGLALSALFIPGATTGEAARAERKNRKDRLPAAVWWLAAYALLSGFALQAANVYLPLYGYQALELPSTTAGALTGVVGVVGLVARIAWGRVVSRVDARRTVLIIVATGATVGIALILLAEVIHAGLVWVGAAVVGGTGMAANVVLMVIVLRVVSHNLVGRATGILAIGLYLGFAGGPVSFGALVDATGDYRVGWAIALVSFLIAGLLAVLGLDWAPPMAATRT